MTGVQTCALPICEKVSEWNASKVPIDKRWVELFTHFKEIDVSHDHMSKIIQFILCLSGTNSSVERVFSQMNKLWTSEKSQLQVLTLKALLTKLKKLLTKLNFSQTCLEFYNFLKSTPELLKKISSNEKYNK